MIMKMINCTWVSEIFNLNGFKVMDYAKYGEIMKWNPKTLRYSPFDTNLTHLPEKNIKKYLRHCVRGLYYSK